MNNEVYQEVYGHILNDAQRIRKEIMNEWGDILMFGGSMPDEVVGELSTAARITGLAFDALSSHGAKFAPVNGKPDLFTLSVREESYICHKSAIPSMSGFLDVVNIPGVPSTQNAETEVQKESPSKKKTIVTEKDDVEQNDDVDSFPAVDEKTIEVDSANEAVEISDTLDEEKVSVEIDDENPVIEEEISEEKETETTVNIPEDNAENVINDDSTSDVHQEDSDNSSTPNIGSFLRSDIFTEETEKAMDEIVYEMFGVTLTHSGFSGGGKSLDAQIMIAPLKIQKFSCPSVPIIVSVYYKGKIFTSSSYDQAEDGRNLVTLNIDEFYLLFRGSFDGNGKFRAFITTTGISASQGDILNITSETRHGDEAGRNVRNGHVKFRATVYDDPGTIEAFPFGEPEDNEFIVMTKTDEFVDYMYISNNSGGLKSAIIFQNGEKKQINCEWDEDKMTVGLKEV